MSILILGATGKIGAEVTKALFRTGAKPVLGVRDKDKAKELFGDKAEYRTYDFDQYESYPGILDGIEKMFFIAPHKDPLASINTLFKWGKENSLKFIVFSSGRTTGDVEGKPLNQVEQIVKTSELEYTILRPGWFMQNFMSFVGFPIPKEGRFYLPSGDYKTAFVDTRDLGAAAAKILVEDEHHQKTYDLTSHEALSHQEAAEQLSLATGCKIEYIDLSREAYIRAMVERGWTEAKAIYVADLYEFVKTGKEEVISPDLENILGRQPISFSQFANDFKDFWISNS